MSEHKQFEGFDTSVETTQLKYPLDIKSGETILRFLENRDVVLGGSQIFLSGGGVVFNEKGEDVDFRIEVLSTAVGMAEPSAAFFVQGSTGFIGFGTSTPETELHYVTEGGPDPVFWTLDFFKTATGAATFQHRKARGTVASPIIVNDNDRLGNLFFKGHDGTSFQFGSAITGEVDGTPGTDDMPAAVDIWTTADGGTAIRRVLTAKANSRVVIADNTSNITVSGQLHVDQVSTTGAIPTLFLDQADISEEMIEFNTTIGTGNAIEAIASKTLTTTHFIKVTIPGGLTRYIPVGTIA